VSGNEHFPVSELINYTVNVENSFYYQLTKQRFAALVQPLPSNALLQAKPEQIVELDPEQQIIVSDKNGIKKTLTALKPITLLPLTNNQFTINRSGNKLSFTLDLSLTTTDDYCLAEFIVYLDANETTVKNLLCALLLGGYTLLVNKKSYLSKAVVDYLDWQKNRMPNYSGIEAMINCSYSKQLNRFLKIILQQPLTISKTPIKMTIELDINAWRGLYQAEIGLSLNNFLATDLAWQKSPAMWFDNRRLSYPIDVDQKRYVIHAITHDNALNVNFNLNPAEVFLLATADSQQSYNFELLLSERCLELAVGPLQWVDYPSCQLTYLDKFSALDLPANLSWQQPYSDLSASLVSPNSSQAVATLARWLLANQDPAKEYLSSRSLEINSKTQPALEQGVVRLITELKIKLAISDAQLPEAFLAIYAWLQFCSHYSTIKQRFSLMIETEQSHFHANYDR